jgi:hypothetical protein
MSLTSLARGFPIAVALQRLLLAVVVSLVASPSHAEGEEVGGFPSWAERVLHELINRARVDPSVDLASCSGNPNGCPDHACYVPQAPIVWNHALSRAARFHSDAQWQQGFFGHTSSCTLVNNISALYPASCNGAASCACVGGAVGCSSGCTTSQQRVALFGTTMSGEIIAGTSNPSSAFFLFVTESTSNPTCSFTLENGHRWLILSNFGTTLGAGISLYSTVDFGFGGVPSKIPSGTHYPRQASQVDAWVNWYDSQGPATAAVNVDGVCQPLTLGRGTATNGAWTATVAGVGSGCHRYYFEFEDSSGQFLTYPTTGSLGIGPAGSCADWQAARPSSCLEAIFVDGFESGNTAVWASEDGD